MPAFSYAQAARGLAPSSAAAPVESKEVSPPVGDSRTTGSVSTATDTSPAAQVNGTHETTKRNFLESKKREIPQEQVTTDSIGPVTSTQTSQSRSNTEELLTAIAGTNQVPSKPSSAPLSTSGKATDDGATTNSTSGSVGNSQIMSAPGCDRSDPGDETKNKDGDEDWEKVSTVSAPPEKELKAAPIPTVNPWQKRAEEQDAKRKALAAQKAEQASTMNHRSTGPSLNGTTSRYNPRPDGLGISEADAKDRRRPLEASRLGQDSRKPPRQARANDRDFGNSRAPPSVHDATHWPTPENAITEEKKTPVSERHERTDDGENKSPANKPHTKEKWVKVDVKWEHYSPPTNARRGGRSNRGGRENGTRGGGHLVNGGSAVDRQEKTGVPGSPAVPRAQRLEERSRPEVAIDSKSSSTAAPASRSPSAAPRTTDETNPADNTKSHDARNEGTENKNDSGLPSHEVSPSNHGDTDSSHIRSNSKTTSRYNQTGSSYKGSNFDPTRASGYHADAHTHPRAQATERRSMPPDLYSQGDIFGTDRSETRGRGYPRDKKDSIKDGAMSWRERDGPNDRPDRRETRSERGRGGYRGRGNHNNYGSHNQNPSWSTPLPQNPFPPKAHPYNERHRQSSAPYTAPIQNNGRSNPRSQSIPGGGYSNLAGYPQQPMSPTQQEFQPIYYPPMAYGYDFNLVGTMRMVQAQIEYYFSIENLCKDLFLRKHMDSKGYVLFTFITSFKRLRQLTDDQNIIRETCAQVPSIEYVRGDDGIERLRRRDNWSQWPLPMEERDPSAQNAGPNNVTPAINVYDRYTPVYGYPIPTGQDPQYAQWMNSQSPNIFSSPVYGPGRNEFEPNATNVSSMNNSGILDSKDTAAANEKQNHPLVGFADLEVNGLHDFRSVQNGYPLSNGTGTGTVGEQAINQEKPTEGEEVTSSGQTHPSAAISTSS